MGGVRHAIAALAAASAALALVLVAASRLPVSASLAVPAVAIAYLTVRTFGALGPWQRLRALPVFAIASVLAAAVGALLVALPPVGAAVFTLAAAGSVWARRFGPRGRRLGRVITAPIIAVLVVPAPAIAVSGPFGAVAVPATAVLAAALVTIALTVADLIPPRPVQVSHPAAAPRPARSTRMAPSTRMAAQLLVALTVAFTVGFVAFGAHWPWVPLTAYIVLVANRGRGDAVLRAGQRLLGALGGSALGALIALLPVSIPVRVAAILLLLTVGSALRDRLYVAWAFALTAALGLLYGLLGIPGTQSLALRLVAILVGGIIGIAAAWWVLPIRSDDVLRRRVAEVLAAAGDALAALREDPQRYPERVDAVAVAVGHLREVAAAHEAAARLARLVRRPAPPGRAVIRAMQNLQLDLIGVREAVADERLDPADPAVRRAAGSVQRALGVLRRTNARLPTEASADVGADAPELLRALAADVDRALPAVARLAARAPQRR